MPKTCGQVADILRENVRKTSAWFSTTVPKAMKLPVTDRVKTSVIRRFIPMFSQDFSRAKIIPLPLAEHYLYPVSTAPINNYNQMKFKER